jgi:transcriptional regulator with XRE-family HTH domain
MFKDKTEAKTMTTPGNDLHKNIRAIRITKGYSQENLAKALGKTQNWVSLVENGKIKLKNPEIELICGFLNIEKKMLELNLEKFPHETNHDLILKFVDIFDSISNEIDLLVELRNAIKNRIRD